jgi:trans-2,3-dihydro-3-hydroxyanthranilate isomerase
MMPAPNLFHVDVFATGSLSGNGLVVFLGTDGWPASSMQRLTQEMKQFESIFLWEATAAGAKARVFTMEEELPFAGHPALGAAVVLHRTQTPEASSGSWTLKLPSGEVPISTQKVGSHFVAEMNQGRAVVGDAVALADLLPILDRLGLQQHDLVTGLPAKVISTGLPYLVLPLLPEATARARINGTDLEMLLAPLGAKFVFVLDVASREIRTWDNHGRVEDVATGSAAGPAAAYLLDLELATPGEPLELVQGRFAGRPSELRVRQNASHQLLVSGEVWPVSEGYLDPLALCTGR